MLPGINRNADVMDWAADTIGAALGLFAFALAAGLARRRGMRLARALRIARLEQPAEVR